MSAEGTVVALSGGVGGAKLADGLHRALPPGDLTVCCNVGDDFEHLGLHVAPDIDTVVYTLAEMADCERGWGVEGETWRFMSGLERLGGETWFQLGDTDLATHVLRTERLRAGATLSAVTTELTRALNLATRICPATDDSVRTIVETPDGDLTFQSYFVRERCAPIVVRLRFAGAENARPAPGVVEALNDARLRAIVWCPSNPFLSIQPMLAVAGLRDAIARRRVPCVAVSPVIGGEAVKGPLAKMMREMGLPVSSSAVAALYVGLIDAMVIDEGDGAEASAIEALGISVLKVPTLMRTIEDRVRLADRVLSFAGSMTTRATA